MPKKHDPKKREREKKLDTWSKKKEEEENIYSNIAMSSYYPNKRERDS